MLLGLASCSSGGGEARSTLPASTTTSGLATTTTTSAVATTTTVVATTTTDVVPPTTTAVAGDATAADPKVLAQQLQAVLDRFRDLYVQSRLDPNLPFGSQGFLDQVLLVVTPDYYGLSLIPAWQGYQEQATSVRNGPSGPVQDYVTQVTPVGPDSVSVEFCNYDDGVTYDISSEPQH